MAVVKATAASAAPQGARAFAPDRSLPGLCQVDRSQSGGAGGGVGGSAACPGAAGGCRTAGDVLVLLGQQPEGVQGHLVVHPIAELLLTVNMSKLSAENGAARAIAESRSAAFRAAALWPKDLHAAHSSKHTDWAICTLRTFCTERRSPPSKV
eukprot:CAMPEP_0179114468 /NCGR_PEP_ID=MMETSP0796-20121207/53602_1 /TAXON_ID=73915 /ORGANISM="Pyrodinium bahamense, Strain pbaha01" /LENGTH=152 /DNA_ID=CAMNT_0020812693 /DNA_START=171 /DNA_END=631 /DNA_ORIENTATION=-